MKMKINIWQELPRTSLFLLALLMLGFPNCDSCSDPAGPSGANNAVQSQLSSSNGVSAQNDGGVIMFFKNGIKVGDYYIIGSCDGADTSENGVISRGANGVLKSSGLCPGSPYSISVKQTGENSFSVSMSVGPAVTDYATISLPLDPPNKKFNYFSFSGGGYEVGCGNSWSRRAGNSGRFSEIPASCYIPGAGGVGAARTLGRVSSGLISSSSLNLKIERKYAGGDCGKLFFYNHPGTNNIEWGFWGEQEPKIILRKGQSLFCREEINISSLIIPDIKKKL